MEGHTMRKDIELRRHGEILITRFNALYKAGYRVAPHWMMDVQFALVHPNKNAPKLALNDDGSVALLFPLSDMSEQEIIDIPADDQRGFEFLVRRTPQPNYLQTVGQTTIGRGVETVIALAIVVAFWFAMSKVLEWLFPGLKDLW